MLIPTSRYTHCSINRFDMTVAQPCISRPPVPCKDSPVKYVPIGEARKTYATATSIGIPIQVLARCRGATLGTLTGPLQGRLIDSQLLGHLRW